MNTVEKRDYIHNYLYRLLDKDIDDVFNKVKAVVEKDIVLSEAQNEELERRVLRHQNGESKSYSWSEVKDNIKSHL